MKTKIWLTLIVAGALSTNGWADDLVAKGKELVDQKKCSICHSIDGKGGRKDITPLNGITKDKTDEYLTGSLLDPKKTIKADTKMPSYKDKLSDDDVKAVIEYLKSLK